MNEPGTGGKDQVPRMSYEDIKQIMERRLAQQKKGLLTEHEIQAIVKDWEDERKEEELDPKIIEKEVKKLEQKFKKYNVPMIGEVPEKKGDGICRVMYCQMNNCSQKELRQVKIGEVERLNEKYDVDVDLFCELGFNFKAVKASQNLASWFENQDQMKCVTANNEHDPQLTSSHHQQGGTGILVRRQFTQYAKNSSRDFRNLGRWCSYSFWVNPMHKCRIVVAYNVCYGKPKGLKTIYQQQLRYNQHRAIETSPKELFRRDFARQCGKWRKNGERLLIVMDGNEHAMDGPLRSLLEDEGVGLIEFSHKYWGRTPPNTYINGKIPVDCGYRSRDLEIVNFCMLPFSMSPGDHRTWILDVSTRSMLGQHLYKIDRPVGRRLVCQPQVEARYNEIVEKQFRIHRIEEKLNAVDNLTRICGFPSPPWLRAMIIKLYKQMDEIRIHAEKKCRKIMTPVADFSPQIQHWYDKIHAYLALIRLKEGKHPNMNQANTYRFAKRKDIENPRALNLQELKDGLQFCRIRQKDLRRQAKGLRKVHLRDCLLDAMTKNQEARAKGIKQKIEREHSKRMWFLIKRTVRDPMNPAVLKVQRVINGRTETYTGQHDVETAIQKECEIRFTLAHRAPIMKTYLAKKLRYLNDEQLARSILDGTFEIPDDMDDATALILEEIGKMGLKIINGEGKEIIITPEDFVKFWKRVGEFTSSSPSGLHYAHYKASTKCELSTKIHAQQLTVIARSGVAPERWSVALQVMLEKIAGVCLVEKLRAIQLYEADYNFFQQFIFGQEAMKTLVAGGFLPEEHFSQKGSTAEDATFDKTLMKDLSRQARHPLAIVSVDAALCYDRVNHIIMSLVWLLLINHVGPIAVVLLCLQTMSFYQRTGYGDSTSFFGGSKLLKYLMGLGQGSRGAPPSWIQISSIIVNILRGMDYGSRICDPISRAIIHTIGAMFVDDTDLYCWHEPLFDANDLFAQLQLETLLWGELLIATGGALKPEKCFWYMLDYECVEGTWQYTEMVQWELLIPQDDGTVTKIEQLDVNESKKTLGVRDCPAGGNEEQLEHITEKMEEWIHRMRNGHLPTHMGWIAYRLQLWPGVRYGIGTMTNDVEEAEKALGKTDYLMLNILGIASTVKKGWRRIHTTFGGFGLLTLPTEQLIERLNLLLQHYHTSAAISKKLDASFRYLQLQLGINKCPFDYPYDKWEHLAPLSWVKMVWRTIQLAEIDVHLKYDEIPIPRVRDFVLMERFMEEDLPTEIIDSLSRVRGKLGCLFFSDIVTADGKFIEDFALDSSIQRKVTTRYSFPREEPTMSDWEAWTKYWAQHTNEGHTLHVPLGVWTNPTHRIWGWYYDEEKDSLQQVAPEGTVFFIQANGRRRTRSEKKYTPAWSSTTPPTGRPVSVLHHADGNVSRRRTGPPLATGPSRPETFWEFLYSWGGEWMWSGITEETKSQDITWLVEGMTNGTLIWVTDGSYDRKRAPRVSGAGWIVYCTETDKRMVGNFYEISNSAGSYRGEQLGLSAVHLLMSALEEFYKIHTWKAKVCCDNSAAINLAARQLRQIRPSAKCADILRAMRSARNRLTCEITYEHVDAHMDRYLLWHQLSLEQKLNCICDNMAKTAVARSIRLQFAHPAKQLLPREDAAVFINGEKMTSEFAKPIRFEVGRQQAKRFLINEEGWSEEQFEEVDWPRLDNTMEKKPDMYKLWLSKQHTGFCGTRVQVGYYSGQIDGDVGCPDCGERETAAHLCICTNNDRTRLLVEMADDLERWLTKDHKTYSEIAYWVPKYILYRGTKKFADLGAMSPGMKTLAESQDKIGWRNFMEGRISKHFYSLQSYHLAFDTHYMNGEDWVRQFITRVLHITHSQWIYRNFSLHDRQRGYLRRKARKEILAEIETLADTNPDEVPAESKFLLEFDYDRLCKIDLDKQVYWVVAMRAARTAGARRARQGARQRRIISNRPRRTSRRVRLGIPDVERQIRTELRTYSSLREERLNESLQNQPTLFSLSKRKAIHPASIMAAMKDNKRRKPD